MGVILIFYWHNPSGCTVALGSTQPVTEMSTRSASWGVKVACMQGWQPNHLHVLIVLKSWNLNLFKPSGPVQGLLYLYMFFGVFTFLWVWQTLCTMCTPVFRVRIQKMCCGAWFEMCMYMEF